MEFWSVVWFGIALIAGGLYFQLRRDHQALTQKMQALSAEFGLLETEHTINRKQMDFLCDFTEHFNGDISSAESINISLETLWQLPEVDSAAILLGENELGPFH